MSGIEAYYAGESLAHIGERKVRAILVAIGSLAQRRIGHRADNDLPREYRRMNVEDYAVFYLEKTDSVLVYDVRYEGRKPLKPATHRRRATKAERDSFDVN